MDKKNPIINFNFTDSQGKTFQGTFKVKKISIFGFTTIETEKLKISQGLGYSGPMHELLIEKMAVIDHMVVEASSGAESWFFSGQPKKTWDSDDMFDMEVLNNLYEEVKSYDSLFRKSKSIEGTDTGSKETSIVQHQDGSDVSDSVVRKDVSSKSKKRRTGEVEFK